MARILCASLVLLLSAALLFAPNPSSGKISEQSPLVTWTGGPMVPTAVAESMVIPKSRAMEPYTFLIKDAADARPPSFPPMPA